jgi:hypothetical protein
MISSGLIKAVPLLEHPLRNDNTKNSKIMRIRLLPLISKTGTVPLYIPREKIWK